MSWKCVCYEKYSSRNKSRKCVSVILDCYEIMSITRKYHENMLVTEMSHKCVSRNNVNYEKLSQKCVYHEK